jgi:hypothetical protein
MVGSKWTSDGLILAFSTPADWAVCHNSSVPAWIHSSRRLVHVKSFLQTWAWESLAIGELPACASAPRN